MNYRGRSVFVTGGAGFVGAALVQHLLHLGANVSVLIQDVHPDGQFARERLHEKVLPIYGSLQDRDLIARVVNDYRPSIVFHLGAQTLVQQALTLPYECFESNIRGTYCLLEALRTVNCSEAIVVASSDKAYGEMGADAYTEEMPLKGEHPYDVSKSCTDLIASMYRATYKLPISIARCGNIYGGGDTNWSRIVPGTIKSLLTGEPIRLRSDGTMVRDYLHLEDVVSAYMALVGAATDESAPSAYNFSGEAKYTVLEIVNEIKREMQMEHVSPIIENSARSEIAAQILDSSLARKRLGWRPMVDIRAGLKESVSWYTALLGDKK